MTVITITPTSRLRRLGRRLAGLLDAHLSAALGEPDGIANSRFDRHAGRLALAFVHLPEGPERHDPTAALLPPIVPLGQLRAVALTLRLCQAVAGGPPRRRAVFAVYAPSVDLPGTGRVRWEPEAVTNLRSARGRQGLCPTLTRTAVLLAQGLLDRATDELHDVLALPALRWAFAPACPPAPEAGLDEASWQDLQEPIGGLATWPHEYLARAAGDDDAPAPMPLQLLADCRELRGEAIRNPAAVALSRRGFDAYQGRTAQEFRREATGGRGPELERHALEIAAAASGIDEDDQEQRYAALLDEILVASAALGAAEAVDFADPAVRSVADDWLCTPTSLLAARGAPTVQVVRILGGVPTPASCDFGTATVHLDASDLGVQALWYAPIRPRQSRRGGRPDRPSRLRS